MHPILETKNLHKMYAQTPAVRGVSFDIAPGEIFSLLGPNGAGKTTTISMLSCLLAPTQGEAWIDGHSILSDALGVKRLIGVVPQEIALYPAISAHENLAFWGHLYGLGGARLKERIAAVLEIAGLQDRARDRVDTFSGGMKRRLNIAVGLLHEPKVLFLDEPTVGIDPQSRRRILDTILSLNEQGLTVLYTTHYMEEAEELSDRIGIIDHGQLISVGTLDELIHSVGQVDTLLLEVGQDGEASQQTAASLAGLPGVLQAQVAPSDEGGEADEFGHLIVQAKDAEGILPAVVSLLNERGVHIRRLEMREPNLEAVFLRLTGRALRD